MEAWRTSERMGKPLWLVERLECPRRDLEGLVSLFPDAWLFSEASGSKMGIGVAQRWNYSGPNAWAAWKRQWEILTSSENLDPTLQVAGGIAFSLDDTAGRAPWARFPRMSWTLPAVTLEDASDFLKATLVVRADAGLPMGPVMTYYQSLLETIMSPIQPRVDINPTMTHFCSTPTYEEWCQLVQSAVEAIESQQLHKVVLARAVSTRFTEPLPVAAVLNHLVNANPDAHVFALRMQSRTFLGATPELLLATQDQDVFTMALAGSAPRGATPHEDHQLAQGLLMHQKNLMEHEAVKRHILSIMEESSMDIQAPQNPAIKRLPTVQHLYTPIHAKFRSGHTVWDLAEALTPTPAVGGHPVKPAIEWILNHEPFDRGWYAGIVGHVNLNGNGKLLVALRSALIEGPEATLFGGCGIMEQSKPDEEWVESQWKIQSMLQAMGIEDQL